MFSGRSETIKTRQMNVQVNVSDKISMNDNVSINFEQMFFS